MIFIYILFVNIFSAFAEYRLEISFKDDFTNSIIVAVNEKGDTTKECDAYIEYPISFDKKGIGQKFAKHGIGVNVFIRIIREIDQSHVELYIKAEKVILSGWNSFLENGITLRQPMFYTKTIIGNFILPIDEWVEVDQIDEQVKQKNRIRIKKSGLHLNK